jgi:hypothetical protein
VRVSVLRIFSSDRLDNCVRYAALAGAFVFFFNALSLHLMLLTFRFGMNGHWRIRSGSICLARYP